MSSALSQKVFQNDNIQHLVRHQPLELGVLLLKLFKAAGIRHVHPAIFGLQLVKTRVADAVLAANLCHSQSGFLLLNHPNNLRLGKTALSHASALSGLGRLYIIVKAFPGGRSISTNTSMKTERSATHERNQLCCKNEPAVEFSLPLSRLTPRVGFREFRAL